jgi:hypothetical protein
MYRTRGRHLQDLLAPDKRFPNKMTVDHVAIAIRDTLEIPHVGSARPQELAIMNDDPEAYAEMASAMLLGCVFVASRDIT